MLEVHGRAGAADRHQQQDRGGECHRQTSAFPLFLRRRVGFRPRQLGRPQPLLHAGQVGGHPLGDDARVGRAVLALGGQAVAGQGDQLGVGPAARPAGRAPSAVSPDPPLRRISLAEPPANAG